MAGGIFTDRPFSPNIKCILFGLSVSLLHVYLPRDNLLVIALIFVIAYVAMAWYDAMYDCSDKMLSGKWSSTGIFKPQYRFPHKQSVLVSNQEKQYLKKVYLFHALWVAPLLIYVGAKGAMANPNAFGATLALGIMAGLYHSFRLYLPREVW